MLQLPSKTPRFSRVQVADITRGAKVTVRDRKPKLDPIIKGFEAFSRAVSEYITATAIVAGAKKILAPQDAVDVWLHAANVDDCTRFIYNGPFSTEGGIKNAVRAEREWLRRDLSHAVSQAKLTSSPLHLEHTQHLSSLRKRLTALPKQEAALLKAFRAEARRVAKLQRPLKFGKKRERARLAISAMMRAFHRLEWENTTSKAGALKLLEVACIVETTRALHHDVSDDMPTMIFLAWKILAQRRVG